MIEPPTLRQSPATPTACIHLTIPRSQMREVMGPAIEEVFTKLAAQGVPPAGPLLAHHLSLSEDQFDFQICVPVQGKVEPEGRVRPGLLPAARVISTVYEGPYEGLPTAWGEFMDWIQAQGLKTAPNLWEIYAVGPDKENDPAKYRTELVQPLAD